MMNNKFLWLVLLLPLLFSCQKYNKVPFDEKEKILRQFPVEDTKTMVLDSLWDKRDSLTYLRLKNLKTIAMNEVTYIPNWIGKFNKVEIFLVVNEKSKKIKKIPSSIGKLSNLLEFNIRKNEVNSIPETFYNLQKLKKVHFENSKASGLKYVKNLLHMNPWFKDEYWYVGNVPYATLQKLLKGKIRRFDKLNNDIDKENTNLTSVFYSGQISPDEFARNKYFLIFKIQHNEQQNDDIFILETVFYEN